ncbi:SAF domain-containing protein [Streptomyces avermitilis]
MKTVMIVVLAVAIMAMGPVINLVWYYVIEPKLGTKNVVVMTKKVERGNVITDQDVKTLTIKEELAIDNAITDLGQVIGKEVTRDIKEREMISPEMIETKHLYPKEGEWNMPLPDSWIMTQPSTLLRGDRISLFPLKDEKTKKNEEESNQQNTVKPDLLNKVTANEAIEVLGADTEEKLKNIVVSYAKNNSQEVTTTDNRKNLTAVPNKLELVVTEEQRKLISNYAMNGFKFLVVYR